MPNLSSFAAPFSEPAAQEVLKQHFTRMQHAVGNALLLRDQFVKSGWPTIMDQTRRIPVVAVALRKERAKNFSEFDVSAKVRERGWVL
jgi:glutamate decarboxylase